MRNNLPNFKYVYNNHSNTLDVLLHGAKQDMNSQFMLKLLRASESAGNSVVTINFPFFDRGETHSSGPELLEEIEAIKQVLKFCRAEQFDRIRLIGKSLGGIVAGYYLASLPQNELSKYDVVIFGYVTNDPKLQPIWDSLDGFFDNLTIVQGSEDKHGDVKRLKNLFKNTKIIIPTYIEIENGDHSYRDPDTKEPLYEDIAIRHIFPNLPKS